MFLCKLFVLFFSNTQHFYTYIHTCSLDIPAQNAHCFLFMTFVLYSLDLTIGKWIFK